MAGNGFDRAAEDIGNIVHLEHVNLLVPDQRTAILFYVTGLGLTRDPYLMTGVDNMWINVGRSQFHLITGDAQVLRGHIGLVIPDRPWVLRQLENVSKDLAGTRFAFGEGKSCIDVTCPWGNRLRIFEPDSHFGRIALGMPYVEFDVPVDTAEGIASFYRSVLGAPSEVGADSGGKFARVAAGIGQQLYFRESGAPQASYDGHHVQIYLANFSTPYRQLMERGLVYDESSQWQYRFKDIVDPASGQVLFTVEHEMRSMTHPLYGRPLVNRNSYQTNRTYTAGHENRAWLLPRD